MELGRIGESCLFQYRISELFCQNKIYILLCNIYIELNIILNQ